ncbi:MAG TPA: BsuPI-related putative proteinase inhibitor [Actinomycetota bacterium]|jgi:hypothetical protein|nr:BsuPI-related putative proteinase inhibitor [Actinomycetota bacterium]
MSDPLRNLGSLGGWSSPAPVSAIKARAIKMERRRHIALGTGGALIAIIGLTTLFAGARPDLLHQGRPIARGTSLVPTPEFLEHTAEPTAEGEGSSAEQLLAQAPVATESRRVDLRGDTPQSTEGSAAFAAPEARQSTGNDLDVDLDVNDESFGPALRIGFTLTVCNGTDKPIEKTFPSGQRYDFEVKQDGEMVWKWSDGRAFTQVQGFERWDAGECRTFTDSWNGRNPDGSRAESGQYEAVGTLTSEKPMTSDPETFCVETC